MNIELLIPIFFFAAVTVIMPAVVLAGLVVFVTRDMRAAREHPYFALSLPAPEPVEGVERATKGTANIQHSTLNAQGGKGSACRACAFKI